MAMSPLLWQRFKPDRFDSYSAGQLLLLFYLCYNDASTNMCRCIAVLGGNLLTLHNLACTAECGRIDMCRLLLGARGLQSAFCQQYSIAQACGWQVTSVVTVSDTRWSRRFQQA